MGSALRSDRGLLLAALCLAGCAAPPKLEAPLPDAWAGATAYDLASKSDGEIRDALDVMVRTKLRVLRVTVLDIEDPLGKWRDAQLARLDYVISEADRRNVRVIVAFHDGPQRRDAYARQHPGASFYKDSLARAAFRRRIEHVLAYRGPFTGTTWSALDDVLVAWELQSDCHWHAAPDWIEDMASYVKMLAPQHKVASGALGNVVDSLLFTELVRDTPSIDLWMYRPGTEPLDKAALTLKAKGRPWMLVDFGGPREDPMATRASIERALAVAADHRVPWCFWSLGRDRRPQSHDLWPGDTIFDVHIARATR
jgi:hypothetical protein